MPDRHWQHVARRVSCGEEGKRRLSRWTLAAMASAAAVAALPGPCLRPRRPSLLQAEQVLAAPQRRRPTPRPSRRRMLPSPTGSSLEPSPRSLPAPPSRSCLGRPSEARDSRPRGLRGRPRPSTPLPPRIARQLVPPPPPATSLAAMARPRRSYLPPSPPAPRPPPPCPPPTRHRPWP